MDDYDELVRYVLAADTPKIDYNATYGRLPIIQPGMQPTAPAPVILGSSWLPILAPDNSEVAREEDYEWVTAEDLTLALLKTHGKFDSNQDRAVAIIKYLQENANKHGQS